MARIGEKFDFFGISDDSLIYDERKKRFVYSKDLPGHLQREYRGSAFKTVSTCDCLLTIHLATTRLGGSRGR